MGDPEAVSMLPNLLRCRFGASHDEAAFPQLFPLLTKGVGRWQRLALSPAHVGLVLAVEEGTGDVDRLLVRAPDAHLPYRGKLGGHGSSFRLEQGKLPLQLVHRSMRIDEPGV